MVSNAVDSHGAFGWTAGQAVAVSMAVLLDCPVRKGGQPRAFSMLQWHWMKVPVEFCRVGWWRSVDQEDDNAGGGIIWVSGVLRKFLSLICVHQTELFSKFHSP